jgi:spore maturation protein CgeB
MFEALACGIPVVSAPWNDAENLFPPGTYLQATDGAEMKNALLALLHDRKLAATLTRAGLQTIADRHTCRHRALELLGIVSSLRGPWHSETVSRLQEVLS